MMQTYGLLTLQAITPIILGSFKSLKTPASVIARRKAQKQKVGELLTEDDEDEDEDDAVEETLSWSDTLIFPIMGSVVLLGFYFILKYVGKEWINLLLGIYFSGAGMFAIQSTFGTIIRYTLRLLKISPQVYHVRISSQLKQVFHSSFTLPSLLLLPFSIALPILYIPLGRPYMISNLIALCLSTATLQLLRLDSFFTAGCLLSVLLIYDIFWVFATPVMVTVAKGIDAPIKLLAPKPGGSGSDYAMLGLGDVVVPGLMVALCLRFDLARYASKNPGKDVGPMSNFSRPYFWTGVISYLIGLGVTMGVMTYFKAAQPALLYLSPACIIGPLLLGAVRGETKDMWDYNEASEDKDKVEDSTIEKGSETARKAKEAAKTKAKEAKNGIIHEVSANSPIALEEEIDTTGQSEEEGKREEEDDGWMDGSGVSGGERNDGKVRKRKGKKK